MRNLIVVCGPAGCGKSTIGEYLAEEKECLFLEVDDVSLHTYSIVSGLGQVYLESFI